MIGADELMWAAEGHIERMDTTRKSELDDVTAITEIVHEETDTDPEELSACFNTLTGLRGVPDFDKGAYSAGLLDSYVIGVRAAQREEHRRNIERDPVKD